MINEQIAVLYGTLELRTQAWDSKLRRIEAQLRGLTKGTFTVNVRVNGLQDVQLLVQQLQQLRGLAGRPFTVNARVNAAGGTGGGAAAQQAFLGGSPLKSNFIPQMQVAMSAAQARRPNTGIGPQQLISPFQVAMSAAAASQRAQQMQAAARAGRMQNMAMVGTGAANVFMGGAYALNPYMAVGALGAQGVLSATRTGIQTEASMASLRAIGGLSTGQMNALQSQLQQAAFELPGVNRMQAFGIAEIGARAGVAGGDLGEFTRGLGAISAATPDADPEKLAEDVQRTMNVFNMSTARIEAFGSALIALDQASVAKASEILDMTRRLAGAGQAAGFSLSQIMAMSAAMKSVGVRSESGTTAMSRILVMLADPEQQAQLAEGLGMRPGQLGRMYQRDPMSALQALMTGVGNARGNRLDFVTNTLGFDNQRDIQLVGQLGGRMGDVDRLTKMAEEQLANASALSERLAITGDTTAAALERAGVALGNLGAAASALTAGPTRFGANVTATVAQAGADLMGQAGKVAGMFGGMFGVGASNVAGAAPEARAAGAMRQADMLGPFGGFANQAAQRAAAARFLPGGADFVGPMQPGAFGDAFSGAMGVFSPDRMNALLARGGRAMAGMQNSLEHGGSVLAGRAAAAQAARRVRFQSSIMDPMSAVAASQVDIMNQGQGGEQQQVNLLGEIRDELVKIREGGGGGGFLGMAQAVLGAAGL